MARVLTAALARNEMIAASYENNRRQAEEAAAAAAMEDAAEAAAELAEQIKATFSDLASRGLDLVGRGDEADQFRLRERQRRESAGLVDESLRPLMDFVHMLETQMLRRQQEAEEQIAEITRVAEEEIERIDELIRVQTDALRIAEDELRAQEQQVAELQRLASTLRAFNDELLLSGLSPLSPTDRLSEARSQFADILAAAQGGDVGAGLDLPRIARALLEASRAVNASGMGFVSDFNFVQAALDALADSTVGQLSIEEQALDELVRQSEELTAQLDEMVRMREEVTRAAEAQIEAITDGLNAVMEVLGGKLDKLLEGFHEQDRRTTYPSRELDERLVITTQEGFVGTIGELRDVKTELREMNRLLRRGVPAGSEYV
jgi:hypothetical protein